MTKTKYVKLWEGWEVSHNGKKIFCKNPSDVWNLFGWDVENDESAKETASFITREIFCFGFMDLSKVCNSGSLTITAIPAAE